MEDDAGAGVRTVEITYAWKHVLGLLSDGHPPESPAPRRARSSIPLAKRAIKTQIYISPSGEQTNGTYRRLLVVSCSEADEYLIPITGLTHRYRRLAEFHCAAERMPLQLLAHGSGPIHFHAFQ